MCRNAHYNFTKLEACGLIKIAKNLNILRTKYLFFKEKDLLLSIQDYNMAKDSSQIEVIRDATCKYSV